MLRTYVELRERLIAVGKEEDGSEVAQAAGVALAAATIIAGINFAAPLVQTAVKDGFQKLIDAL